jgi:hypothetical protein
VSNQNKQRPDRQLEMRAIVGEPDVATCAEVMYRLHPSLITSFVALPRAGIQLTREQLYAVFGGDVRALREIAQLAYQTCQTDPKL